VPPSLDRIVTKALAKDPAERYQSGLALRDALQAVQEQTAAGRVVRGVIRTIARSRGARRMALAAGLIAIVAGGGWYLWAGRDRAGTRTRPVSLLSNTIRLTKLAGVEQFPSLTPDGKWLLYAGEETGNRDIYRLSTAGQNPTNLTADSPADDDEPTASPTGDERIAFRSSRDGGGIFVMGPMGENPRRVTPVGVTDAFNPAWSPDGTEIAYATENVQLTPLNWESGQSEIWTVNVTTAEQRRLDTGNAVQPSWSPHGHRIAYVARGQRTKPGDSVVTKFMDIYTVPSRGGAPVAATDDLANDWSPVWSPDGRYLYFVSDRSGSMNLWRVPIVEASGKPLGDPEPVTSGVPFLAHPSISADGLHITYCAKLETGNINKIALDPGTAAVRGEPTPVTTGSQAWANPDPTPDGEWVVFYSRNEPEGDLYITRSDGTGQPRQLTSDAAKDRVPRWSPDNQWIAFTSDRSGPFAVWKIRFDGGGPTQIASPHTVYPVWSPDGTRLAAQSAAEASGRGERFTVVLDPNRSPQTQTPEKLPLPDAALQPFHAQDWSQDDKKLAGQIGMGGGAKGIVIYTFASRIYERMTDFGEWPAWLPDNRRVMFVTGGKEYWVVDTRTKRTQKIYTAPRGVLGPARLTRDGRMAVFPLRLLEADIYLLTFEE
jgi:Tol biopolymer transport system component